MRKQATIQAIRTGSKARSAVLLALALGTILSALVAMITGTAQQAEAASTEKVVFFSHRTTGTGVNNPTGDFEIYRMSALDGSGQTNLTNTGTDVYDGVYPD